MWKFLSVLNLVCIMFISGCIKNSNDLKKYDLEFARIKQSAFIYKTWYITFNFIYYFDNIIY
ncbi:hypothetical protein [Spiroplasma endosymbiont of Tipula paludosa]|uniref:hypothetical protein n=1 Tax=Spiroplasma endosymbiont of Tipula paludosa TaxID=3066295 RepID=UPI0035C881E9